MTPLILVTADMRRIDGYVWHCAVDTYLKAVAGMGGAPLVLPSMADALDIDAVLARVDGVLLTGSRSNVHPARYGVEPSPRHEPYDPDRDATVFRLIDGVLDRGLPLLAICRGFQELNVALGGTLLTEAQERPGCMDHRAPESDDNDRRFGLAHPVRFEPGSRLAALIGRETIEVNSLHRQVIDRLSPRLIVAARAPDGTVDAVRVANAQGFAYGFHWHPDYWSASDPASNAIFAAFGDAARAPRRGELPAAAE